MKERNKKWSKPKLIILTRGKHEEMVLVVCKFYGHSGPGDQVQECFLSDGGCGTCWSGSDT